MLLQAFFEHLLKLFACASKQFQQTLSYSIWGHRLNLYLEGQLPSQLNGSNPMSRKRTATPTRAAPPPPAPGLPPLPRSPRAMAAPSPAPNGGTSGHYACLWGTPLPPRASPSPPTPASGHRNRRRTSPLSASARRSVAHCLETHGFSASQEGNSTIPVRHRFGLRHNPRENSLDSSAFEGSVLDC